MIDYNTLVVTTLSKGTKPSSHFHTTTTQLTQSRAVLRVTAAFEGTPWRGQ